MASLVVTNTNDDTPTTEGVFAGLSFFLTQRLPSRSAFIQKLQTNGGRVVKLEAQADHIIADHVKPAHCPPGSISFTFIDQALQTGALPDPADHIAGVAKGTVRDAGSGLPKKGTRTPFTAEDDRELYTWVKKLEVKGGNVKGNEIYKQLELRNGRHTYQSWRDRYIKKLMDQPPAGVDTEMGGIDDGDDDAPTVVDARQKIATPRKQQQKTVPGSAGRKAPAGRAGTHGANDDKLEYSEEDMELLVQNGSGIQGIASDRVDEAFKSFAELYTAHTGPQWRRLWITVARYKYLETLAKPEQKSPSRNAKGQSAEASQAETLKRKRPTPSPRKQATYGRKKQRDDGGIFGKDASEDGDDALGQDTGNRKAKVNGSVQAKSTASLQDGRAGKATPAKTVDQPIEISDDEDKTKRRGKVNAAEAIDSDDQVAKSRDMMVNSEQDVAPADQLTGTDQHGTAQPINVNGKRAEDPSASQLEAEFNALMDESSPIASQIEPAGLHAIEQPGELISETTGTNFLTSDVNRNADQQLRRESLGHQTYVEDETTSLAKERSDVLISDVNGQADQQVRHESLEEVEDGERSDFLTSDINRQADQQFRHESLEQDEGEESDSTSSQEPRTNLPASHATHDSARERQQEASEHMEADEDAQSAFDPTTMFHSDAVESQIAEADSTDLIHPEGDALTEANLASQQQEHTKPQLRGTDLPPDDENDDQTNFLEYLQKLQQQQKVQNPEPPEIVSPRQKVAAPAISSAEAPPNAQPTLMTGLPARGEQALPGTGPLHEVDELPESSQQEVDEAIESNLQWPQQSKMQQMYNQQSKIQQIYNQPVGTRGLWPVDASESKIAANNKLVDEEFDGNLRPSRRRSLPTLDQSAQQDTSLRSAPDPVAARQEAFDQELGINHDAEARTDDVQYPVLPEGAQVLDGDADNTQRFQLTAEDKLLLQSTFEASQQNQKGLLRKAIDKYRAGADEEGLGTSSQDDEGDGELDLAVPAPLGGFGMSSSPLKHGQENELDGVEADIELDIPEPEGEYEFTSSPPEASQNSYVNREAGRLFENDHLEREAAVDHRVPQNDTREEAKEIIDISSAVSSSSSEEDDDEDTELPDARASQEIPQAQPAALDTQDLFNNIDTQFPNFDFDIPMPSSPSLSSDPYNNLPSDPLQASPKPRYIESQNHTQNSEDDVDSFIARQIHLHNHAEATVIAALKCTSMRTELAELVLLEVKAGKGVPRDVRGVWSAEEDAVLEGGNARALRALEEKHGWGECEERLEWLGAYREEE